MRYPQLDDEIAIVDALVDRGQVSPGDRSDLVGRLAAAPERAQWAEFLWTAGLGIGTALVLSGVMYLVAFNWDQLGIVTRLAFVFTALIGSVAGAMVAGPRSLPGQLCTTGAAVFAGSALVVYSQVYQSGADPWELFASWTVLSLPFVLAARTGALWALLVVLVDVTIGTWLPLASMTASTTSLVLTGLAVAHVALGEAFRGQWLQQVLRLAGTTVLTGLAALFVWEVEEGTLLAFVLVLVVGIVVQAGFLLGAVRSRTATLAYAALAITAYVWVLSSVPYEIVDDAGPLLLLGSLVAGLTGWGFVWLVGWPRLRAHWGQA